MKTLGKIWNELSETRRIERLNKLRRIKDLQANISGHKKQIKEYKKEIKRIKWTS